MPAAARRPSPPRTARLLRVVLLVAVAVVTLVGPGGPTLAAAQTTPTTEPGQVPTQEIVPRPNSGTAPHEAGDRGGALQLLLPVLLLGAIGGGVWHVSRQARRHRATEPPAER